MSLADNAGGSPEIGGLRGLARFSVNRRVTIVMLIMIVALFGVVSFFGLGLDMLPEIEFPQVTVMTVYPGAAPEDVETQVTRPIEAAVATVKNVTNVYSTSQEGSSTVVVQFEWGTDIDYAAQDVRDRVAQSARFIPDGADTPLVLKFDMSQMPIIFYGVTGMDDTSALRALIQDAVAPRLERVEGVASVMAMGGLEREIKVLVDADRMRAMGVSLDQIMGALRTENVNVSGGQIVSDGREHLLRTVGEYGSVEEVEMTIVAAQGGGAVVRISDVARVADAHSDIRSFTRVDGRPNVMMGVMRQSGANTSTVCRRVVAALDEMATDLPEGIRFAAILDQGEMVDIVVSQTSRNAIQGGLLAIVFVFIFLKSWRPTLTIAITIPLSILATFIGMYAMGYTFNLITLGGLALGVGMLVDNAVVVIENTFRHLEAGEDRKTAAINGAGEVGLAITTSTLTTMAVFLPMVLAGGLAGQMTKPMGLTVCVALAASLFVAVSLVPAMASLVFKSGSRASGARPRYENRWFNRLRDRYASALPVVLRHRVLAMTAVGVAVVLSVVGVTRLGMELMPQADDPMLSMSVKLPVGTPLDQTDRVVRSIENYVGSLDGVRHVAALVGPIGGGGGQMGLADVNQAMLIFRLTPRSERDRLSHEIIEDIRRNLPNVRGAEFVFAEGGMASMSTSADRAPIAIRVFGPDLNRLQHIAEEISERIGPVYDDQTEAMLRGVLGLRDVVVSSEDGKPELRIAVDRHLAAEQGLVVAQVASTARTAVLGTDVGMFRAGGEDVDINVRLDDPFRGTTGNVSDISLRSPMGHFVRLGDIATIDYATGPLKIEREGQERKIVVTANVVGRDMGSTIADIRQKIADIELPGGYFIDYGGSFRDMEDTFSALGWALLAAIVLLYMVMAAQFESLAQPFVIMFTVPLSFIGVVIGLTVFGMTLSMPAFMGLVILTGIVVNNGIVLVDYINQLRRRGVEKHAAILEGAVTRLRPILITSTTTILGMLPMGLSTSEGAEMRAPMGIAIVSGLAFAMVLTLFVIPIVYSIVDYVSFKTVNRMKVAFHGEEEVNPAVDR